MPKKLTQKKIRGKRDEWKNFEVLIALYDLEVALAMNTHDLDKAKASLIGYVKKHFVPIEPTLNIKK